MRCQARSMWRSPAKERSSSAAEAPENGGGGRQPPSKTSCNRAGADDKWGGHRRRRTRRRRRRTRGGERRDHRASSAAAEGRVGQPPSKERTAPPRKPRPLLGRTPPGREARPQPRHPTSCDNRVFLTRWICTRLRLVIPPELHRQEARPPAARVPRAHTGILLPAEPHDPRISGLKLRGCAPHKSYNVTALQRNCTTAVAKGAPRAPQGEMRHRLPLSAASARHWTGTGSMMNFSGSALGPVRTSTRGVRAALLWATTLPFNEASARVPQGGADAPRCL
ncbi:unnamed protein product [Prorocentrum cordatum]|uniref:Uncharacterized protein n=1 Tax=Prorocentrum cordatum TaxID=2364126 RepID=A0ABN9QMP4_9DINO|nr:unnamed protein product [Polarella glacialis]